MGFRLIAFPETMEHACASPDAPRAGTGWADHETPRAERQGHTGWALLTRYAIGDDTIGSRGFITTITRTARPRPFGERACEHVCG
jgi:hypothetical protein